MTSTDLEARVRRLEDRNDIIDVVIRYATSIDQGDWAAYGELFTDPVHVDFSEAGLPANDFPRDAFVAFAKQGLEPWTARQHLSPNHVVTFDEQDPDRATCHSYMYAQHYREDAPEVFLMRGSYDHHLVRTPAGWQIARLIQHVSWLEGAPRPATAAS